MEPLNPENDDWDHIMGVYSTSLKRFYAALRIMPLPAIRTINALEDMSGENISDFLDGSGIIETYQKTLCMLRKGMEQNRPLAMNTFEKALRYFPVLKVEKGSGAEDFMVLQEELYSTLETYM